MIKARVAVIGLGLRGYSWVNELLKLDNIVISAVCDNYADRVEKASNLIESKKAYKPFGSCDYNEIISRDDVDIVMVITSWETHVEVAIASMKAGKFTAMEVGGAYNVDECWDLVNTYEETKTPFMFMENCCYGQYETMVMEMVKKGMFGDIVHCEGGYCHDLRNEISTGEEARHYRLNNYINRNCENYPTHEIGPIAKILGINNGNRFLTISSFASKSMGLKRYVKDNDLPNQKLKTTEFAQADIVKSFITCENGETICITLDTTLPRFYSRGFTVRGTKGMYFEDTNTVFLDKVHEKCDFDARPIWDNAKEYAEQYHKVYWENPEEIKKSGHGGMDYVLFQAILEAYTTKAYPAIDIYDAAAWMVITALSEKSLENGGAVVEFPDFTKGNYKNRTEKMQEVYGL